MTLTTLLTTLRDQLAVALPGWEVVSNDIPQAKDNLVELVYLEWAATYPDMTTLAYTGVIGLVFYKAFNTSYMDQIDAIETTTLWLQDLSIPGLNVGNNTDTQSIVDRPSVAVNSRDELFRTIMVNVAFEVIVE